jgi:hypothetical protein
MVNRPHLWTTAVFSMFTLLFRAFSVQGSVPDAGPALAVQDGARNQPVLSITFSVFNYADVPLPTLKKAEEMAHDVLAKAGIASVWVNSQEMNGRPIPFCRLPRPASSYAVRIFRDCGKAGEKFKRNSGYAENGGAFVTIYYKSVMAEAEAGQLPTALVLGHVLAHEAGHLHLPPGYHSTCGIMKAVWHQEDFYQAWRGALLFSEEEARMLRTALLNKSDE